MADVLAASAHSVVGGGQRMNEMWEALERYQPYADKHGFGPQWLKMTTERTAEAARAAWAAEEAKAEDAAAAIRYINEAIALEEA